MYRITLRASFPIPAARESVPSLFQARELDLGVELAGLHLNKLGMLHDFAELKRSVRSLLDRYLSEGRSESVQSFLEYLYTELGEELPDGVIVERVSIQIESGGELSYDPREKAESELP